MKPANAKQKQWMKDVASWADGGVNFLYGCDDPKGFELHHVLGRSAKHNKTAIGHWFIIPVPYTYHNIKEKNDRRETQIYSPTKQRNGREDQALSKTISKA